MNNKYPIPIKDLPLPTTDTFNKIFETAKAALMEHGIKLEHQDQTGKFIMSWQKESKEEEFPTTETMSSKILLVPVGIKCCYGKSDGSFSKRIDTYIISADFNCAETYFSSNDLDDRSFRRRLDHVYQSIILPEDSKTLLDIFKLLLKSDIPLTFEYFGEGLTFDHKYLIYKGTQITVGQSVELTQDKKENCERMFRLFMGCCSDAKALLLLMIQLMGLSFETIKALPSDVRRNCLPTVLPYVYGDTGCGKSSICKALFNAYYCDKLISMPNATLTFIQKKLSSIYSGVVLIDDIPPNAIGGCSKEIGEKLEAVLRTYGDIGGEKQTAFHKFAEVKVWAVVTAEDLFLNVPSSIFRILPIRFHKDEINIDNVGQIDERRSEADKFFECYLEWFSSKLKLSKGRIVDIPQLSGGYYSAREEVDYMTFNYPRVIDSHVQLINFSNFISEFWSMIGISDEEILTFKMDLKSVLSQSVEIQREQQYEYSLEYYITKVLEDFILDNKFIPYECVGSNYHKITTDDSIAEDAVAYKMGNILIFDAKQRKGFFDKIRDEAKVNDRIKDAVLKRVLFAMGLVVDVKEETPVYVSSNYNDKVRINGKETRVLKLDIKKIMED